MGFGVLCRATVASVAVLEHVFHEGRQPVAAQIDLVPNRPLTVRCSSDGWGLRLDEEAAEVAQLGDYGSLELTPVPRGWQWTAREVEAVHALTSNRAEEPFGLVLRATAPTPPLYMYNWGDEFRISASATGELRGVTYVPVCDGSSFSPMT